MRTYLRLSVLSLTILAAPLLSYGAEICGSFSHIEGDVKFQAKGGQEQWQDARVGSEICPGGSVATSLSGRASIKFPGGEELHISPKSRLVISAMESDEAEKKKKALMNLLNGKVRANIPPGSYKSSSTQFRIKSETAVAGVRGTQFVMSYSSQTKQSEVVTLRGAVEVGKPTGRGFGFSNPVMVRPGQKTIATPQAAPSAPIDIPAEEFKSVDDSTASNSGSSSESKESSAQTGPAESDSKSDTASSEPSSTNNDSAASETKSEPVASDTKSEPVASETKSEPVASDNKPAIKEPEKREPSSSPPPPSMVAPADLAPPPDKTMAGGPNLLLNRPIANPLPPPVVCEFCEDRIVDGPARIKLKVKRGTN